MAKSWRPKLTGPTKTKVLPTCSNRIVSEVSTSDRCLWPVNWGQAWLNNDAGSYCQHIKRGAVVVDSVEKRLTTGLLSFPIIYS